jgi:hypothetical protein
MTLGVQQSQFNLYPEPDLHLQHLQATLSRLDAKIQRAVRCWQLAGQDPTDPFRGLRVEDPEAEALLMRPLGGSWGRSIMLDPAEEERFRQAEQAAKQTVRRIEQQAAQLQQVLRLHRLAQAFHLNDFEVDALLICLAPMLDLRYERIYAYLQDDVTRKLPSVNLILDLLSEPGLPRLRWLSQFTPAAPLRKYQLLNIAGEETVSPLNQTYTVDPAIVLWLMGRYYPPRDLDGQVELIAPAAHLIDDLLTADIQAELARAAADKPIVVLQGVDQAGQLSAARVLAQQLNRSLLLIHLDHLIADRLTPLQAVRLTLREAALMESLPCLAGWETCLREGAPPPEVLAELCQFEEPIVVMSRETWLARDLERERQLLWLTFSVPTYGQRRALWEHYLPLPERPDDATLTALAGQFLFTATQIRDTIASARDAALQCGAPLGSADLFAAARAYSNPALSSLARKITPRYAWNDIVLPADQMTILREIIATVQGRPTVLEEWGVGRKLVSSNGVTVLFSGPPGTGKTMAAEIIAAELGLDLYKIELSTIVSKYIGETEKNLEKIFAEAQSSNAILFFDEADAIFGKRSEVKDAHDRYANIEISYLLQRMEAYDGVTILATNLRANLDEAFTRRLQFAVDFPFPDEVYRLRIWQTLFPPDVPRADDLDFALLARRFKLAGGNIRNIIVSAAYLAAANGGMVGMEHLLHGVRRELQKMGRLVNEKDLIQG